MVTVRTHALRGEERGHTVAFLAMPSDDLEYLVTSKI
jgi:hypothetical protein